MENVTRTLNLGNGNNDFVAILWEKYGKRIVYFHRGDKSGQRVASYDLNKQSWRETTGHALQKHLMEAFSDILVS